MIVRKYGVIQVLVTSWVIVTALCSTEEINKTNNSTQVSNTPEFNITSEDISSQENITDIDYSTVNNSENVEDLIKSHRRAAAIDSERSKSWVRVYNRPPGAKAESYFNYGTRGNTSAQATVDEWSSLKKEDKSSIDRSDSTKGQDLLRVKPKMNEKNQNLIPRIKKPATLPTKAIITTKLTTKPVPTTTIKSTSLETTTSAPVKNQTLNKPGFIVWSTNDGATANGWTLDDPIEEKDKTPLSKEGSRWNVVGEGGEEGWQVLDDDGDVEWKIEYDDGEWRVTSTGDIPADAEWVDPEYFWGPSGESLAEDDEYNSWPADDYNYASWVGATAYSPNTGNLNESKQDGVAENTAKSTVQSVKTDIKDSKIIKDKPSTTQAPLQFGTRKKLPSKNLSRTDSPGADVADDTTQKAEKPQTNGIQLKGKSWGQNIALTNVAPKHIEAYGSKTWEADNTGYNSNFGGDTWLVANKDFPTAPWVPKSSIAQDTSKNAPNENENIENPIQAWGTGYGTKTWKGNAWDSNVVWKTGFGGALPWAPDNSNITWPLVDQISTEKDSQIDDKKDVQWSQPVISKDNEADSKPKPIELANQRGNGVRIKWPSMQKNRQFNSKKSTPSRRTEEESWGDDASVGGVVWKDQKASTPGTDLSTANTPANIDNSKNQLWQTGGWKVKTFDEEPKLTTYSWKNGAPIKTSNLISVKLDSADESGTDSDPDSWNQGQWPSGEINGFPYWVFGGCKIQCRPTENDANDDASNKDRGSDTPDDDTSSASTDAPPTTASKEWPSQQTSGKSWKPPSKSWKPPKPKRQPPTKSWRPPATKSWQPPPKSWKPPIGPNTPIKLPIPPPNVWKNPTPSTSRTEPTPPPTTPWTETSTQPPVSWNPPATFPPSMQWKNPGIKSVKSWRPPPTKSWKPPTGPGKSWKPSIATPLPDTWSPPTKPDCKDSTQPPPSTSEPKVEKDDGDEPPKIIIITKLPKKSKIFPPTFDDKDTNDDSKTRPTNKPWKFPARKYNTKSSKNRKDKFISPKGSIKRFPLPPGKYYKPGSMSKGWPKGVPPPTFVWPVNKMRKFPGKKLSSLEQFKKFMEANQKKTKSGTWKQMIKKWINGG